MNLIHFADTIPTKKVQFIFSLLFNALLSQLFYFITPTSRVACVLLVVLLSGCVHDDLTTVPGTSNRNEWPRYRFGATVPGQVLPPDFIKSIDFTHTDGSFGIPVLQLGRAQQLQLSFDDFREGNQVYNARITHHNADWQPSPLVPTQFMRGFLDEQFQTQTINERFPPYYSSTTFRFPESGRGFLVSGHYMLSISDMHTREVLFSLPFLVAEQVGSIDTNIETLVVEHGAFRTHQLFTSYSFPEFVEYPMSDLELYYVQNQLWGQKKKATLQDQSTPGIFRYYLTRNQLFNGTYEVRRLDISTLTFMNSKVMQIREDTIPPQLTLLRDLEQLDTPTPRPRHTMRLKKERDARYGMYHFYFEPRKKPLGEVYLIGDFNQWSIHPRYKLQPDATGLYTTKAMLKEGVHSYKYVTVTQGQINDTVLDTPFSPTQQLYAAIVIFKDRAAHFDRILFTQQFMSN